jgi:hypothetical protein
MLNRKRLGGYTHWVRIARKHTPFEEYLKSTSWLLSRRLLRFYLILLGQDLEIQEDFKFQP